MGDISHLLKPHVLEGKPYSPTEILRMLYETRPEFIRLMGNESPFGISPKARQAIIDELPNAHLYPDSSYYELRQALAEYTGFTKNHIVIGNGSTQFLDSFYDGFINTGDAVLFVPPDYEPYRIRLQIYGGVAQLAPRPPPDYSWNIDKVIQAITPQTKIIVIISPNNPVGNCVPESEIRRLLNEDLLIVIDEAYYEFAESTLAHLINDYPNLIVTRTFAKAFGFAGLRLGYAITNPKLATYLTKVLHHFQVNRLTAAAGVAALKDTQFLDYVRNEIRKGRTYLENVMNTFPDVRAFPSQTNFVLAQFSDPDASSYDIAQHLLSEGILVRDYTGKPGLDGQFIRITVGTKEQNEACINALKTALKL